MATPTMSVRAPTEHHQRIRRIARALTDHPELAGALDTLIEGVTQDVTAATRLNTAATQNVTTDDQPNTAAVQRIKAVERQYSDLQQRHEDLWILAETIQERLGRQEKSTVDVMAMAENINDRVKVLEQRAGLQVATQQHEAVTQKHSNTATRSKRQSRSKATKPT
jgi:hypothetical protein